jgi:hypothetical protein
MNRYGVGILQCFSLLRVVIGSDGTGCSHARVLQKLSQKSSQLGAPQAAMRSAAGAGRAAGQLRRIRTEARTVAAGMPS